MMTIWFITTATVAVLSAIIWTVPKAMGETGEIDVWAARVFFLSPLWPMLIIVLVVLIARTAFKGVEK